MVLCSILIRGGTIIDGTGSPAFTGDVAIEGDVIVGVGKDLEVQGSPRVIDAQGKLVAPGWIDVHTQ